MARMHDCPGSIMSSPDRYRAHIHTLRHLLRICILICVGVPSKECVCHVLSVALVELSTCLRASSRLPSTRRILLFFYLFLFFFWIDGGVGGLSGET